MIVFYRMCAIPSTSEPPIYTDNKLKFNEICLRSFIDAYKEIKPKMVFINDYCDADHIAMINKVCPFEKEMKNTQIGINESCLLQYKLFEEQKDDVVLFQECDYLHVRPLTKKMIEELQFVTSYDHPDKYDKELSPPVRVVDKYHFKQTSSTTSTFATTRRAFEGYKDLFYKYGYIDKERWEEINKMGGILWSPIPALATHMLKNWLSPFINWEEIWKKYEK